MTERAAPSLDRGRDHFQVGPSVLRWQNDRAIVDFDEWAAPIPKRTRGRVTIVPHATTRSSFQIDDAGRHAWWPIAPSAHIKVELLDPALTWTGHGYMDTNMGSEPLEAGFKRWDWSRAELGSRAALLYDATTKTGANRSVSLLCDSNGEVEPIEAPPRTTLGKTGWGIQRGTQSDGEARVVKTLEDTPFYARSVVETEFGGRTATAMHETLDCDRFASNWVRMLLPWKMPRRFI
ncbi:MAG: carotenoid 1,2-hydratase [Pseudomonadota bacterium]